MKYYSALKRNKILTDAATWMNPRNRPFEMNETKHCMIALRNYLEQANSETKSIIMAKKDRGESVLES